MKTTDLSAQRIIQMGRFAAIFSICTLMLGCRTIQVSDADFLRPDLRPAASVRSDQTIDRFTLETPYGELTATRISRPGNRTAVLYCGGNNFRTEVLGGSVVAAFPASVDLIMFDYPGYGNSTGTPTVENLMESATIVYDRLLINGENNYEQHAVYGSSMGGFIASHVAAERNPELLMLEGTAASTSQLMNSLVPWFAKPFISFEVAPSLARIDNVAQLRDFRGDALLLVGSADSQTKPTVMREFSEALRGHGVDVQFRTIEGRGHGNVLGESEARKLISNFLEIEP